jgi:alpha-L-fucosidase
MKWICALLMTVAIGAAQTPERMQWFTDARFGMFLHWGVYSAAGGEWKGTTNHAEWLQFTAKIPIAEYTQFASQFNPVKFNADEWARMAKDAGMRYVVITSKHHDGFAMYDSKADPYNIVEATKYKHDPMKDLAAACKKYGLKFCFYYSLGRDWHDPDVATRNASRSNLVDFPDESKKDFSKYFERKVKPQVRELLTNYGPIGIMWFDTPELISKAQSEELVRMIHELQPQCIINQRVGNKLGDYGTPEQKIPGEIGATPWETCMTMNGHWGYNSHDQKWKSPEVLVRNLIDIASKGGNYLLNIGPTGEGVFPPEAVERLSAIGAWMKVNGEAIYGTGATPFGAELKAQAWRATTKPGRLYIHVFQWPEGKLQLPPVKGQIARAYLLAGKTPVKFEQSAEGVSVTLPKAPVDTIATVVRLDMK